MSNNTRITDPSQVRGVVVVVNCPRCDGTGKTYATERSRHPTECKSCDGDGTVKARLPMDAFHRLLDATENK